MSKSAWMRPFVSTADQDDRNDADGGGVDGFDATTWGVAAGIDGMVSERTRLGFSFTYSNSDVDGNGIQDNETEIAAYQFTLYADYSTDKYYIEGLLAYAYNDVDTSRRINFGGLNLTAKGSYNADQYTARLGGGIPLSRGKHVFTPHAAFQYSHLNNETFTESGAGVLNLVVDPEDLDMAVGILGLNYQSSHDVKNGVLTPQIRTSISYDFASDEADSVSRFTGVTTTFATQGAEVEEFGGSAGAGLTFSTSDGRWDIGADYDADIKQDFLAHTGRLRAKYNF
jgi:outer membrane autotransporter protein